MTAAGEEVWTDVDEEGDIFHNGTVIKTITKPGTGVSKPDFDDEVLVGISTTNDPAKLNKVLPRPVAGRIRMLLSGPKYKSLLPLVRGIRTMKVGEEASFKVGPITYKVVLAQFWRRRDVSRKLDGGVVKKVITAVRADEAHWKSPKDLARIRAHVAVRLLDAGGCGGKTVTDSRRPRQPPDTGTGTDPSGGDVGNGGSGEPEPLDFVLDDTTVIRGVEEGLLSMKEGETAEFEIRPELAYGTGGDAGLGVPANSTVTATVTLVTFVNEKVRRPCVHFGGRHGGEGARACVLGACTVLNAQPHAQRAHAGLACVFGRWHNHETCLKQCVW